MFGTQVFVIVRYKKHIKILWFNNELKMKGKSYELMVLYNDPLIGFFEHQNKFADKI